ncbi:NAD(P)H-binding protein [Cognatilysobacter terrigena]|uniref:NAD(P)H-binding protein n=1 Tax=Cognatilysobacter terrigena TaxID=2488749 RepID=UPI00106178B8|nr:NAD(P)H-binding protein [Lysobacter terrigena]
MRILVTGATGFIGSAIVDALIAHGHVPVPAVRDVAAARRRWPTLEPVAVDFARDTDASTWQPRLDGIDAVVNAVGILRESRAQPFAVLHDATPRALFDACVEAGVSRVVQVSALGADDDAASRYHLSKRAADRHVLSLPLRATVVQPSVVFAPQGASAGMFLMLASLPFAALPGGGVQRVAPVHLDDVIEAVLRALESDDAPRLIEVVGPECTTLREYLATLRRQLGLGRLRVVPVPMPLVRLSARVMQHVPGSLVEPETIAMLERGNCAPPDGIMQLLGRAPRSMQTFVPPALGAMTRADAVLRWALPLLRVSIAAVFIVTGLLSLGLYPVADSYALLARSGVTGGTATTALYAGALLDLLLGVALLLPIRRGPVYLAMIALIVAYTIIITVTIPAFWMHPFGPVLKNLPILAALALLHALDRRR